MKKFLILLMVFSIALPVLAKKRIEESIITPMTQLEKRQYQTKTYSYDDKIIVMKSLLNVLQDEGYIVYNVNSLLGFIYGVKDFDTTDPNIDISKEFGFTKSRLNYNGIKIATFETTANITQYGDNIRVRVNFKRKLLNEYGNAQFIDDVTDREFYEEFYSKVDNAINLQKQTDINNLSPKENPVVQKIETVNEQKIIEPEEITELDSLTKPPKDPQDLAEDQNDANEEQNLVAPIPSTVSDTEDITEESSDNYQKNSKSEEKEIKNLAKQQIKQLKQQEKQAKQDAKILKELEKITE